ncbi:acyl-CoA synthetase (AMP-forming)/AMP-acid ligase II [Peribacillus simplex]|nr:acyl-CoA synthetase (AMP-forming)/AMP-acid ligase II [Peribacillus simplex]
MDLGDGTLEVAPGEMGGLVIKGPQVMKGYWNMPEETVVTLRDGWLYTGDIAKVDEEGYLYIVDRKKDLIIASGYNIYPRDVEEVLYEHPAVQEAVVFGVPDAYRGESVKAVLVLKNNKWQVNGKSSSTAVQTYRLIKFRYSLNFVRSYQKQMSERF